MNDSSNTRIKTSSKYLINEYPMMVLPSLASRIGIDEAIILQQIQYWVHTNQACDNQRVYREGRWWVFNTIQEWQQKQFVWLSVPTIKRILQALEQMTLVATKQFDKTKLSNENQKSSNRKWYTINYESIDALDLVPEKTCFVKFDDRIKMIQSYLNGNRRDQIDPVVLDRPDQIDPIHEINLIPSTGSNRSHPPDQIDPVFLIYKETTSKETTEETREEIKSTQNLNSTSQLDLHSKQEEEQEPIVDLTQESKLSTQSTVSSQEQLPLIPPEAFSQVAESIQPQSELSQGKASSIIPFPSLQNLNSDQNSGQQAGVITKTSATKKQKSKKVGKLTEEQLQFFLNVYQQEKPSNFANHKSFSENQIKAINKLVETYQTRSLDIFGAALKFVREDQNDWWRKGSFTLSNLMTNSKMTEFADIHFSLMETDTAYCDRVEGRAPSKDKSRNQQNISVIDQNGRSLDPNGATAQAARAVANNPMLQKMLAFGKKSV